MLAPAGLACLLFIYEAVRVDQCSPVFRTHETRTSNLQCSLARFKPPRMPQLRDLPHLHLRLHPHHSLKRTELQLPFRALTTRQHRLLHLPLRLHRLHHPRGRLSSASCGSTSERIPLRVYVGTSPCDRHVTAHQRGSPYVPPWGHRGYAYCELWAGGHC